KSGNKWTLSLINFSKLKKLSSKDIAQHSRIILRNVRFNVAEDVVRKRFSKYGPIYEISLLIMPGIDGLARHLGCCFVQYYNPCDAARAILSENGTCFLTRLIAVDWAIPKVEYKDIVKSLPNNINTQTEKQTKESKIQISGYAPKQPETISFEEPISNIDNQSNSIVAHDLIGKIDATKMKNIPATPKKNYLDPNRTVFATLLPTDMLESEIAELFESHFGIVSYCMIVRDKIINLPTGSAFIKFVDAISAEKAILNSQTTGTIGDNIVGIEISGVKIIVRSALTREELVAVKENRNLLGTEVLEGSTISEIRRRKTKATHLVQKLKDPKYFVSQTRICLRNLPATVDEKMIRNYIIKQAENLKNRLKVRVIRDNARNEPKACRKAAKIRKRSLGYAFIECNNKKIAKDLIEMLDGKPVKGISKDETVSGNLIAEYSIENKDKLSLSMYFMGRAEYKILQQYLVEGIQLIYQPSVYHQHRMYEDSGQFES
ncbi:hypothetical protein MXB_471, partial [Myxobolus squamalis]